MTRQRLIIIFAFITIASGCDLNKRVNDKIDKDVKAAKTEMNSDITKAKSEFVESYKQVLAKSTDATLSSKVSDLYLSISKASEYIDSLRIEMDKLDNTDVNNVELVRRTFINNGIGDSVFHKIKLSYTIAIDVARADTTKTRLRTVHDSYTSDFLQQLFALNAPLGAYMTLYGIESELIKDGTRSLYGYQARLAIGASMVLLGGLDYQIKQDISASTVSAALTLPTSFS